MSDHLAGSLIAFSEGEYSDYGYAGLVRAIRDISVPTLAQEFKDQYRPKNEWDTPNPAAFLGWLTANGYVEAVDYDEVHLGSYGRLEDTQ